MNHNPKQINALLAHISAAVNKLASKQRLTCAIFKYVPGAKDKAVSNIEQFVAECVTMYNNLDEAETPWTFEDWKQFRLFEAQIRINLRKLFWGTINENRQVLEDKHWKALNPIAVILIDLLIRIRGEYENSCTD